MSVGTCQLRNGVIWNADDCRRAEARIELLERVAEAARAVVDACDGDGVVPIEYIETLRLTLGEKEP